MRVITFSFVLLYFSSCLDLGSKEFDWREEWKNNKESLKALNDSIYQSANFKHGNHDFPNRFSFPFDAGYSITNIDSEIVITYYTDRGLLDHYSGFVYTEDSIQMLIFDSEVENGGNDHFLELNWYYISN